MLSSPDFSFFVNIFSILLKFFLFSVVFRAYSQKRVDFFSFIFLSGILIAYLIGDFYWVYSSCKKIGWIAESLYIKLLFSHLIMVAYIGQFVLPLAFVEYLLPKQFHLSNKVYRAVFAISTAIILYSLGGLFGFFDLAILFTMLLHSYVLVIMAIFVLRILYIGLISDVPRLLQRQLLLLGSWVIVHYISFDFIFTLRLLLNRTLDAADWIGVPIFGWSSVSAITSSIAIFIAARKLLKIRFLNIKKQVETAARINLGQIAQGTLSLQQVETIDESRRVIQEFFNGAFNVPFEKVKLYIYDEKMSPLDAKARHVLRLCADEKLALYLDENRSLVRDEIEFSLLYEDKPEYHKALELLDLINAAVFLPVYVDHRLIAYISIDPKARSALQLYSKVERDEMVVFASYLSSVIAYLQSCEYKKIAQQALRERDAVLVEKNELENTMYQKDQKIQQYEESIQAFVRTAQNRKIGIIEYIKKKFIYINEEAELLLGCDLNKDVEHPVAHYLKLLVKGVERFGVAQNDVVTISEGVRLTMTAIPVAGKSSIMVVVHRPDIAETLRSHVKVTSKTSDLDYVLYLETTEIGRSIMRFIPGSGIALSSVRVAMIKAALSRKGLLINGNDHDKQRALQIIHEASSSEMLHIISLQEPEKDNLVARQLFGIDTLLLGSYDQSESQSLLQKLHQKGALHIENAELLSLKTQDQLADFLKTGHYVPFYGKKFKASDVRVIFTFGDNVKKLVKDGVFSQKLFDQLFELSLPNLLEFSEDEFIALVQGMVLQESKERLFKSTPYLTPQEFSDLNSKRPAGIQLLRKKIRTLMNKNDRVIGNTSLKKIESITKPAVVDMNYVISLGRDALKDRDCMEFLWKKFDKNQTKIADSIGVNRSSVSRRCKFYNLV